LEHLKISPSLSIVQTFITIGERILNLQSLEKRMFPLERQVILNTALHYHACYCSFCVSYFKRSKYIPLLEPASQLQCLKTQTTVLKKKDEPISFDENKGFNQWSIFFFQIPIDLAGSRKTP
jgi:hypothetical protein